MNLPARFRHADGNPLGCSTHLLAANPISFSLLGFSKISRVLYEIANAGFSCHQLPVAPLPVDVPPPNDEELSKDGDGPV